MEGEDLAAAHVRRLNDPAPVARAQACRQLAQLAARGDRTRASIREAGGVEGVLPLLHAAPTQAEAAQAIAALAVDAETRVLIRSAGGCAPLVQALQSKSVAAQEEAARALGHLSRDEEGRVEVAELGGVVALVELLQRDDREMQLAAAGALNQLAHNAENRVTIVGADGHDAMIELLRGGETPAPARLQAEAAGTLASLAFYGPNKRKIREGGGLERLVGALASGSVEVADAAAAALSRLTKHDAECQAAVSAAGGVRALAALLWSENETSRQYARAAIENLGAHPETEKAAWAKAKADEKTGQVAEAEKLREAADESLLVGELDAAAATYTEALALHPRSALLQRRLARTEHERVSVRDENRGSLFSSPAKKEKKKKRDLQFPWADFYWQDDLTPAVLLLSLATGVFLDRAPCCSRNVRPTNSAQARVQGTRPAQASRDARWRAEPDRAVQSGGCAPSARRRLDRGASRAFLHERTAAA